MAACQHRLLCLHYEFQQFSATYGSLGGIIVLMLWLYLTGFIFIIGGEVNAILYRPQ
nr:YhjD/YihY/BrkB family envelope integrity protein [Sinobaca sp. H24]